jgi:hypothetical protein
MTARESLTANSHAIRLPRGSRRSPQHGRFSLRALPGLAARPNPKTTHHRFGQFSDELDRIRTRLESAPIERADLQKLCAGLGIPGDFDVALITWKADYDAFYYRQLCKRARRLYLFRSEYIFDLERTVIVEIPQRALALTRNDPFGLF